MKKRKKRRRYQSYTFFFLPLGNWWSKALLDPVHMEGSLLNLTTQRWQLTFRPTIPHFSNSPACDYEDFHEKGWSKDKYIQKITCLLFISKRFRHESKSHLRAERRIQLSCLPSTMKGMQCLPAGPAYLPLAKHGVELRGGFSEPRMNSIKA